MAGTVNVPGIGATSKNKTYMIGGAVALVIAVAYYRSKSKAAAASTSTTSTTNTAAIDPATGYAYGSPEDAQALGAQAGYQYGSQYGGATPSDAGNTSTQPPSTGYATDAQWSQAAQDYLTNTVGAPAGDVANALGKYLTGSNIVAGSAEDSYIQQAIAFNGLPPVSGVGGFPPSIRHVAAGPSSPPKTAPKKLAAPSMFAPIPYPDHALIRWHRVPNATSYIVKQMNGSFQTHTSSNSVTVPRPKPYKQETFTVTAVTNKAGYQPSDPSLPSTVFA